MSQESDLLEMGLMARECSPFGGTFKYGAFTGPCSLSTIGFGARLVSGGFSPNAEVTLTVRKSILPDSIALKSGQEITATDSFGKSHSLKISTEGIRDCLLAFEIVCDDLNQKA